MWEAILLGVVQGLTEWLPVSSSGHLVLAQELLGIEAPLFFDLVVHVATLAVVLVYYRADITLMLASLVRWPKEHVPGTSLGQSFWANPHRQMVALLVVGTIPIAVVGLAFQDPIERAFESLFAVGIFLCITGLFLLSTRRVVESTPPRTLKLHPALVIGLAQAAAILPGISRSGATIGASLHLGLDRQQAARFSFLLAAPAILGATILQATPGAIDAAARAPLAYLAGFVAAGISGYLALAWLVGIVKRGGLHRFGPYCLVVGAVAALTHLP